MMKVKILREAEPKSGGSRGGKRGYRSRPAKSAKIAIGGLIFESTIPSDDFEAKHINETLHEIVSENDKDSHAKQ